ncbi:MAG: ABC transporter permease subunit [Anaerolineales bacterium]|nr:ABC transporter permease subunit [Anaerolineales bacterium]
MKASRATTLLAIARRVAVAALTLLAIIVLTYVALALARGDGMGEALQRAATQTPRYLLRLAQRDFGMTEAGSLTLAPVAVSGVVREAIPRSVALLLISLLFAALLGVPLGMIAVRWRDGPRSVLVLLLSLMGISMPSFFAIILLQRLVLNWRDLTGQLLVPVGGFGWDAHIVLPALVLAARPIAQLARVTALSLQEVLAQDYVRVAHAKGLTPIAVLVRHVLRNTLIPILTTLGVSLRFSLSSLPVVETFFGWNGAGVLLLKSIGRQDDDLTLPLVLALGALFVLVNLLLEGSYRRINPRLQASATTTRPERRSLQRRLTTLWAALRDALRDNPLRRWWVQRRQEPSPNPFRDLLQAEGRHRDEAITLPSRDPRWRRWRGLFNLPLLLGGVLVIGFAVLFFFGPALAPRSPYALFTLDIQGTTFQRPPLAPQPRFPWGTDALGRDILSLVMTGTQQTLTLALLAVAARLLVGSVLGAIAGWWRGGWLDRLIGGTAEVIAAFPTLLLAMLLILALGIRQGMMPFIVAFCVVGWGEIMQFVRSETIAMRPQPWIESARAVGLTTPRILLRHIFPNLLPALIALAALEMGAVLMLLGELGFLSIFIGGGVYYTDMGLFADIPEWGSLLADARHRVFGAPWMVFYPGAVFFVAILSFNLFGEGLRRLSDKGRFHAGLFFNRYTLIALLLVALAVGWLRDNTGAVATYKQQASVVDGAQALAVAEALSAPALQSRALGSEGMRRAAAQIAAEFEALGLQAAGESLGYFQSQSRDYLALDGVPTMTINDGGPPLIHREDFALYPAPVQSGGSGSGPVRVVALADSDADPSSDWRRYRTALSDVDSADEVLLVLTEADMEYALFAPRQAILVVEEPSAVARQYSYSPLTPMQQFSLDVGEGTPIFQIRRETADRFLAGSGETVASLRAKREGLEGDEVLTFSTGVETALSALAHVEKSEVANVIGHLPGNREDLNQRTVLVLAPYDSPPLVPGEPPTPAANDNGSGVALMLEIVRALQASDYNAHRTFLFIAYSGEGWQNGQAAIDPDVDKFLQARQGFDTLEIEAVVFLRGLGAGDGNGLTLSSAGGVRLTELVERSARRMGVGSQRTSEALNISLIYDERAQYGGGGDRYPTVRPHWQGWEQAARTPADTLDSLSADKLEQAGEAIAMALIALGRELDY